MSAQTLDLILTSSDPVSANATSPGIDVSQWDRCALQAIYTYAGGETSVGNANVQSSVDGINWSDYPNSTLGYGPSTGSNVWELTTLNSRFYRLYHAYNSGTGGLVQVKGHLIKETK